MKLKPLWGKPSHTRQSNIKRNFTICYKILTPWLYPADELTIDTSIAPKHLNSSNIWMAS